MHCNKPLWARDYEESAEESNMESDGEMDEDEPDEESDEESDQGLYIQPTESHQCRDCDTSHSDIHMST